MIFAPGDALAARCNNLNFNIEFAEQEVDITGKPLGFRFPSFLITNYGSITCDGSYDNDKSRGGFVIVQSGRSPTLAPLSDTKSQISIADSGGRVGLLAFRTGNAIGMQHVSPGVQDFILEKKMPGETVISIQDVLGSGLHGRMFSAYNLFDWYNEQEDGSNISVSSRKLKLIYRPTCSASVNNVDFGNINVGEIINGVTKQAVVDIDCNDLLLAYSINISSNTGTDKNVIFSDNATVGYSLTWGDLSQSGLNTSLSNQPIELNSELNNGNKPLNTRFSIPINITPVSRLPFGKDIKPGKADSVINIELKFK